MRPGNQPYVYEILVTYLYASMRPGPMRPGNNTSSSSRPSGRTSCFNEARADAPGKLVLTDERRDLVFRASMRPGPMRPGNDIPADPPRHRSARFNEARADAPGKQGGTRRGFHVFRRASMRPGPMRPGNSLWSKSLIGGALRGHSRELLPFGRVTVDCICHNLSCQAANSLYGNE